ncbi:Thiopurine S-methyltransferase [Seminavis robusta]|uniref:thiopurine S-methyltransferase n=1 Tax=Seminavis robusta TaxID=568900 RepID=A0A9N8HB99_9STRA|nr:Thiopurine S-methyltransferase [Seminavis robusta]|eukprot:Sro328_g118650.1 Thiopurine S-methyltransferase (281) ;mRNA; f:38761-39603
MAPSPTQHCAPSVLKTLTVCLILQLVSSFSGSSMSQERPLEEQSDRLSRWHNRWDEKRIGWHREEVNPGLIKYGTVDKDSCPAEGLRWFVPLCGKTVDMAYLASQETTAEVVGVDGVLKALESFVEDHPELKIEQQPPTGKFEKLTGTKITLLKGDFFALDVEATGGQFDTVFDRASMVAIDPSLREDYVNVIGKLLKPGGKIILGTLERRTGEEEAVKKGPPFSISEAEVRRLYEKLDWVESITLVEEIDEFARTPEDKIRYEGVTSLYELYFLIQAKA